LHDHLGERDCGALDSNGGRDQFDGDMARQGISGKPSCLARGLLIRGLARERVGVERVRRQRVRYERTVRCDGLSKVDRCDAAGQVLVLRALDCERPNNGERNEDRDDPPTGQNAIEIAAEINLRLGSVRFRHETHGTRTLGVGVAGRIGACELR
jgi:hypothetical protein